MKTNVAASVFKRNFVAYFSSPIGYVFICAFVLLTAFASFWPNEFFNANLANLEQLNERLPWILLIFVPAITMSVWAEERRQGTDELLLTLPAGDLEIVLGKYFAALATYSVALVFSLSNIVVLLGLGDPDLGLLLANYVGFWFAGAAMIAVGMIASFLTANLTVGFILAIAFNAPLIFAAWADAIVPWGDLARFVEGLSLEARLADFNRGVVALSGVVYFTAIGAVMLYVAMILIARRHWSGQSAGLPLGVHYVARSIALIAIAIGASTVATRADVRLDVTSERLSSLSADSESLLEAAGADRPVIIHAYVSADVPEEYVQTRLNLLTTLREVDQIGGDRIVVQVHETERFGDAAAEAREQFGIMARPVSTQIGGRYTVEEIYLGAAFLCGLEKVVLPFIDRGLSPEYEIVRSIATVSRQERQKLGVLLTDARIYGGFDMQTFTRRPDQPIIDELRKQYDLVEVNATSPIPADIDVLLAVQPSSLPQPAMDNFLAAVARGTPTAIFEDPFPSFDLGNVPATSEPRRPPGNNPFQQQPPPEPKGDIRPLWVVLQTQFDDQRVIWDRFMPYPKLASQQLPPEFIFIGAGSGADQPFADASDVTRGLQEMLLPFPGALAPLPNATNEFTPLLYSGTESGFVAYPDILQQGFLGPTGLNPNRPFVSTKDAYVLAARFSGEAGPWSPPPGDDGPMPTADINATLVADIDCLYPFFFALRAQGEADDGGLNINFDNVTFVLNVLDDLAGDDRFIEIRKRRPRHRTLSAVEERTESARDQANAERERFIQEFNRSEAAEQAALQDKVDALNDRDDIDPQQKILEVTMLQEAGSRRLDATIERLARERDEAVEKVEQELSSEIREVQNTYKLGAVALPPIPPLILAFVVWLRRRSLEQIGVPAARKR